MATLTTTNRTMTTTLNAELQNAFNTLVAKQTSDYVLYGNFKMTILKYIRANDYDSDDYADLLNEVNDIIEANKPIATIDDYRLNHDLVKTQFKFSSKEEKSIYTRFIENHESNNKYMFYSVVDANLNYKTKSGEYFFDKVPHLTERFNEISNFEFMVVDKEFLENNDINKFTNLGVRYMYYVDINDYNASTKSDCHNSVNSKIHKDARVFKSYEALIEHIEEKISYKAIYILSDKAYNAMRYMVSTIEFAKYDNLKNEDTELVAHDIEYFNKFNCFRKINKTIYDVNEMVKEEVNKEDMLFSDFIKFADKKHLKESKSVNKKFIYELITMSKPQVHIHTYRLAKRKGNQALRVSLLNGVYIEMDENFKITSMSIADAGFSLHGNTDYVWVTRLKQLSIAESEIDTKFSKSLVDRLTPTVQLQIRATQA
jgi:hypothetical protein